MTGGTDRRSGRTRWPGHTVIGEQIVVVYGEQHIVNQSGGYIGRSEARIQFLQSFGAYPGLRRDLSQSFAVKFDDSENRLKGHVGDGYSGILSATDHVGKAVQLADIFLAVSGN